MPSGLEPDQLIALLHADLAPWVKERAGLLSVAADPWHLLELLAEKPVGWRGVLHYDGDSNRQDMPEQGTLLDCLFSFGVTCQRGLSINPDERLFKTGPGDSPALLRLVALARARIRSFVFPADCSLRHVHYLGADPVILPEGTPLMGYRLRFRLIAQPEPVVAYRGL